MNISFCIEHNDVRFFKTGTCSPVVPRSHSHMMLLVREKRVTYLTKKVPSVLFIYSYKASYGMYGTSGNDIILFY